jgi:hypothetical protein
MNTLLSQKTQTQLKDKLYIKVKQKTVIYYSVVKDVSDDQLEGMMVDSIPFGYTEPYV